MDGRSTPSSAPLKPIEEVCRLAAVSAFAMATYAGTLRFGFVSDDNLQIADNPYIKSWRYLPHLFVTGVWSHLYPDSNGTFYRPIYLVWNLLNYSLFGMNPAGWHATTVLLFVLVTALVYVLVRRLSPQRPALALFAALIFAVHPIHHEAVSWISGVTESLCTLFIIAGFLAYLHSRERSRTAWKIASCVCYCLAVFSKETGIILPALVFAHAWIVAADDLAKSQNGAARLAQAARTVVPYLPIAAIYLVMRMRALNSFGLVQVPMPTWSLLTTLPSVLLFYLKQWVWPLRYSQYYDLAYYHQLSFTGVVFPALVLATVGTTLWLIRRRLGQKEISFAAVWLVLPLLPALDLGVFRLGELAHDRYFYAPSIGAAMLTALLLDAMSHSGPSVFGIARWPAVIGLALAVFLSFRAVSAEGQWANDMLLLTRAHEIAPQNEAVRNDLGAAWIDSGRLDDAHALLADLVRQHPENWMGWMNLGRADYQMQDYIAAEKDLQKTLTLNPRSGIAYILLGQSQLKTNQISAALGSMKEAVELLPMEYRFRTIYGSVLEATGDCRAAMAQFVTALMLHPGDEITLREEAACTTGGSASGVPSATIQPQ